jgi:hypothetical protein
MTGRVSEGGNWEPLPEGDYTVQIDQVEFGTNKTSDLPHMMVKGHVVGGAHADKKVTIFYSGSVKSLWKTQALLDAAEVSYEKATAGVDEDGTAMETVEFDDEDLLGCEVTFYVSQRDHQGKMQNDFNKERSPAGTKKPAAAPAGRTPAAAPAGRTQAAAPARAPAPAAAPVQASGRTRRTAT